MTIINTNTLTTEFSPATLISSNKDCGCNQLCVINWKQPNPMEDIVNPAPITTL